MKASLLAISVLLFSQISSAAYFTPQELERVQKCSKQLCFGNNEGRSFLWFCESVIPEVAQGRIAAMGPMSTPAGGCYCPCTYEFLAGARRD